MAGASPTLVVITFKHLIMLNKPKTNSTLKLSPAQKGKKRGENPDL